jgi:parallel beta-helix repeat protein
LTIKVKCDRGQSVQSALDSLTGPATIEVTGNCKENLIIVKDDVTINAINGASFAALDANQNTIQITGARRVIINGAIVKGGKNGVAPYQGGSVTVKRSVIQDNSEAGILANFGALVIVDSCTIQNNDGDGVFASANSSLQMMENTITENKINGVKVYGGSQATIVNNTIKNNEGYGVFVFGSSARLTNNIVKLNNLGGVGIGNGGNARIGINDDGSVGLGNTIESNQYEGISISNGAVAQIHNNTIRGNGIVTARAGIGIYRATGHHAGDNTIEGNGSGVQVNQGSLFNGGLSSFLSPPGPDMISGNQNSGIAAWDGASLDIQNAVVTDNSEHGIILSLRSILRIYKSTVSNNNYGIGVYEGSAAAFYHPPGVDPVIITDNSIGVNCGGSESSITGDSSGVTGNKTDFSQCSGF